jgi:hypothetical protein
MAAMDTKNVSITAPTSGPSTTILTSAVTTSLTHLGYDSHLIQRVALLTSANTHTVECTILDEADLAGTTHEALATLFSSLTDENVRINSNEPVLLVNGLNGMSASKLHEIVDAAAASLRDSPSIRPVRVYAGNFTPSAEQKQAGYSISLLNVVNTDIGGPGMVQLLDMADWKGKGAVRREMWDGSGWNLIEREDKGDEAFEEVGKAESDHSEVTSDAGEWESEPEQEIEEETKGKEVEMEDHETAHKDVLDDPSTIDAGNPSFTGPTCNTLQPEEAEVISDLPTDDPWSQRPQLRDIKHPSWEREHDNETLLDMISKQSSRLATSKTGNAYATAEAKEKADLSGEDDYEVV